MRGSRRSSSSSSSSQRSSTSAQQAFSFFPAAAAERWQVEKEPVDRSAILSPLDTVMIVDTDWTASRSHPGISVWTVMLWKRTKSLPVIICFLSLALALSQCPKNTPAVRSLAVVNFVGPVIQASVLFAHSAECSSSVFSKITFHPPHSLRRSLPASVTERLVFFWRSECMYGWAGHPQPQEACKLDWVAAALSQARDYKCWSDNEAVETHNIYLTRWRCWNMLLYILFGLSVGQLWMKWLCSYVRGEWQWRNVFTPRSHPIPEI